MTNKVIKTIASQCPTTLEELEAVDGLGQQKFKEYGERLIRAIAHFVQSENLEELVAKRKSSRPTKARKVTSQSNTASVASLKKDDEPDDEFPLGFDESELLNL